MAEEVQAAPEPVVNKDPFDSNFGKPVEPIAPAPVVPVDTRPRNPDGTFARAASEHPSYLVNAALRFGYSQAEIDSTPTDQLHRECNRIYNHQETMRQEMATQRTFDQDVQRTQDAIQPPKEPDAESLLAELEAEGAEPRYIKVLREALLKSKKTEDIEKRLAERERLDTERSRRTLWSMVDDAFESLGTAGEEYFGKGPRAELVSNSEEAIRRDMVYARVQFADGETFKAIEKKIHSGAKLFIKAAAATEVPVAAAANPYQPAPTAPVARPIASNGRRYTEEEWAAAGVARPTHRTQDDLPTGEEKALATVAAHLQANDQKTMKSRISQMGLLK